jgi:hypothetical protein
LQKTAIASKATVQINYRPPCFVKRGGLFIFSSPKTPYMKHCCIALLLLITTLATAQNGNKPAYWLGKSVGKLPMLAYGLGG